MTFGNYNPLNAAARNIAPVVIVAVCTGNGIFTVALSTGQSGSYTPRYMTRGATSDQLDYNLYTNAAHTIIFGDGSGDTQAVSWNFNNNTRRIRVHGQISAMENIAVGSYIDSITATLTF